MSGLYWYLLEYESNAEERGFVLTGILLVLLCRANSKKRKKRNLPVPVHPLLYADFFFFFFLLARIAVTGGLV